MTTIKGKTCENLDSEDTKRKVKAMKRDIISLILLSLFFLFQTRTFPFEEAEREKANLIIDQSTTALVGGESFKKIKNLSFRTFYKDYQTVETSYFADNQANFKMTKGVGPYVDRITSIKDGIISDNNFLSDAPLSDYYKAKYSCFARLISGAFTLIRFKDSLLYKGDKKYGFKTYHILETSMFDHLISFYLEKDTFLLGRMIISGKTDMGVSYLSMYDYGEPVTFDGLRMPGSWMHNFLGAGGIEEGLNTIEEFKVNIDLENNFREDTKLNFGSVEIENGTISGNVMESFLHERLQIMILVTNIRWQDMEILSLDEHDDLTVMLEGIEYPAIYFPNKSNNPAREKRIPPIIFAGDVDSPYIGLFLWGDIFREKYEENVEPLLRVSVRKPVE